MSIHQVYGPRYEEETKERERVINRFYEYLRSPRCAATVVAILKKSADDTSIKLRKLLTWSQTGIMDSGVTYLPKADIYAALKDGLKAYGIEVSHENDDEIDPKFTVKYDKERIEEATKALKDERDKDREETLERARSFLDTDKVLYPLYRMISDAMNDEDFDEVQPMVCVMSILKDVDPKYNYKKAYRRKLQALLESILVARGFLVVCPDGDCKYCDKCTTGIVRLPPKV